MLAHVNRNPGADSFGSALFVDASAHGQGAKFKQIANVEYELETLRVYEVMPKNTNLK